MDLYIELATESITHYLKTGKILEVPNNLPKEMLDSKAGIFVSIHNKNDNSLRGCIGTFLPVRKNIAEEIIYNAVAAATEDPRFEPVNEKELDNLMISVDVLSEPKEVPDADSLDPKKFGLIVSTADGRRGLLLPDIPGVETVKDQIEICRQKGSISPDEPVNFQIFTVERHE